MSERLKIEDLGTESELDSFARHEIDDLFVSSIRQGELNSEYKLISL